MTNVKKLLMASAGGGSAGGLNVENVFNTAVYDGNATANTKITTGIDLQTEGGLLWTKTRSASGDHYAWDTVSAFDGGTSGTYSKRLKINDTDPQGTEANALTSFETDGFIVSTNGAINGSGKEYVSWTFRKAEKFFDIVTWTGNGVNGRSISHSLNSLVGMVTVKSRSTASTNWSTWHRGASGTLWLNDSERDSGSGGGQASSGIVYNPGSNTSAFTVDGGANVNQSGRTYTAYLWAHNNGDGEFGPTGDQDIIKCGNYTGNNSTDGPTIDLGFEPQWVLVKNLTNSYIDWYIFDNMRGFTAKGVDTNVYLSPNRNDAEDGSQDYITPRPDGFQVHGTGSHTNASTTYIYMAIRRGLMATPTSATDVFALDFARAAADNEKPEYRSGFPVDTRLSIYRNGGSSSYPTLGSRLTGKKYLVTSSTAAENNWSDQKFDYMNGFMDTAASSINTTLLSYMWRRAPNFFDVVCYNGTGSTRTVTHNLGVAPEMMWFKGRNQSAYNWMVYHENISPADGMYLSDSGAASGASFQFASTSPTATVFTVGSGVDVNNSNEPYIAVLFATLAGISKVGNYTGNGGYQVINCGFSNGARFVLIKRTDASGDWVVYDTSRGITQSTDPHIDLNNQNAETTGNKNYIYPSSSGFGIQDLSGGTNNPNINVSNATYVFYAIA